MPTFDGLDLLDITPNVRSERASNVSRPVVLAENPQGNVLTATTVAPPGGTHQLDWHCTTRAELAAVEAFLQARKGQSVACWIPTYQQDVAIASGSTGAWVVAASAISALPVTAFAYRRWIRLGVRGLSYDTHWFDLATDNTDGTWTWDYSVGGPGGIGTLSGDAVRVCRLMQCRMASDSYAVTYHTGDKTTVSAEFVEVAGELTR